MVIEPEMVNFIDFTGTTLIVNSDPNAFKENRMIQARSCSACELHPYKDDESIESPSI
jgi:hypothetical protein